MKKSMVLLVSLLFISLISLFILKNMNDTERLIDERNSDITSVQILMLVDNLKNELGQFLFKHRLSIKEILEKDTFEHPLALNSHNIKMKIFLREYVDFYDLNEILKKKSERRAVLKAYFVNNGVNYDAFENFLLEYMKRVAVKNMKILNQKQVNQIIDAYKVERYATDIEKIEANLGTIEANETTNYVVAKLDFNMNEKAVSTQFIYDLNSKESVRVKNFEINFR